jgi:hypothetical protein
MIEKIVVVAIKIIAIYGIIFSTVLFLIDVFY